MRRLHRLLALALVLGTGASCVQGDSLIDLHGPDGIAFSVDDPLRVQAGVNNGLFFLSLNSGDTLTTNPGAHGDDVAQLCFVNLTDMTISRLNLMANNGQQAWLPPDDVEDGAPPNWSGGDDVTYYAAGDALKHVMNPASPGKNNPAARLDAELIKNKVPLPSFLVKLEELRFEGVKIDRAQVVGVLKQDGDYEDALTASAKLTVEAVHIKLGGLLGGLLGGGDGWMRIGGSTIGSDPNAAPPTPPEIAAAVDAELAKPLPGGAGNLTELGVSRAAIIAAARGSGDCNAVKAGLSANAPACQAVNELVAAVKGPLESYDQINQANNLVPDQRGGLVQTMIDKLTKNGDWLKFKNPRQGANAELVSRVVKNRLADEIKKFSHRGGSRPRFSGAHMFNTLYMYGGTGRWLVNRRDGNNGFENLATGATEYRNFPEGLVENFVYARLGRIDTTELFTDSQNRPCAIWQQLDLITQKPKAGPAPLPWPPGLATNLNNAADAFAKLNTGGALQICADEAAVGQTNDPTEGPSSFASMVVALNPKPESNELHAGLFYRCKVNGAPAESNWVPWPLPGQPRLKLPADYNRAGRRARYFAATLTNRIAPTGPVPADPDAQAGAELDYNWDYDGDGNIDSDFGRGVRQISKTGVVAMCYIQDPKGRTGAGGAPIP